MSGGALASTVRAVPECNAVLSQVMSPAGARLVATPPMDLPEKIKMSSKALESALRLSRGC